MKKTAKLTPAPNTTHVSHLAKAPTLRHRNDAETARELEGYIADAENGLRSMLKAGFFIECIAADLPQGQLGPWVEAHCQNRTWRSVQRWKEIAAKLAESLGITYQERLKLELHKVLSLPIQELPSEAKPIREKLDAEVAGKSYRQLFLKLSQSDDGETSKRGRRPGEGGRPPAPTGTIAEIVAARAKQSLHIGGRAVKELEKLGYDFMAWDDGAVSAHLSALERTIQCERAWLNTPPEKRDMEQIAQLWKSL